MDDVVVEADAEIVDLVGRMLAAEGHLGNLIHATDRARDARVRVVWMLVDRLVALAKDRPGVRWRVGDTVYWLEDARIRSTVAEPPADRDISLTPRDDRPMVV